MRHGSGRLRLSKIGLMSKGEIKIRLNNEKRLPCKVKSRKIVKP